MPGTRRDEEGHRGDYGDGIENNRQGSGNEAETEREREGIEDGLVFLSLFSFFPGFVSFL